MYSEQLVAMFNYIIVDLILFLISLASIVGLLVNTFLHQRLLKLFVYDFLLFLNVSLIALKTQLTFDKDRKTSKLLFQQYINSD